eukprot:COSAG01_NODE_470_length_16575_cov_5.572408_18_plen_78_part_00
MADSAGPPPSSSETLLPSPLRRAPPRLRWHSREVSLQPTQCLHHRVSAAAVVPNLLRVAGRCQLSSGGDVQAMSARA